MELIVVGFKKDMYRASEVLNKLRSLQNRWAVDLRDAVAVYRDYSGELRVDQSYQMTTGEGAAWGGFWGFMIGSLLAAPFTAGVSATTAGATLLAGGLGGTALGAGAGAIDADTWKQDFGISDAFVREVGGMIQPGDSAIFALLSAPNKEVVAEQFRGYGGTIFSTTLTPQQQARVERVLKAA